jgi:hypothetical protein
MEVTDSVHDHPDIKPKENPVLEDQERDGKHSLNLLENKKRQKKKLMR